jgi:hypothetical protein
MAVIAHGHPTVRQGSSCSDTRRRGAWHDGARAEVAGAGGQQGRNGGSHALPCLAGMPFIIGDPNCSTWQQMHCIQGITTFASTK